MAPPAQLCEQAADLGYDYAVRVDSDMQVMQIRDLDSGDITMVGLSLHDLGPSLLGGSQKDGNE